MMTEIRCQECGEGFPSHVVAQFGGTCPACVAGFAAVGEEGLLKAGATFGRYTVVELVGRGGMGVVYRARQQGLDRTVALKVVSPRLAADPEFVRRFEQEAKTLASLNHPNIVAIHDTGVEAGTPFLVMEFVEGVSLRRLLAERRLPPEEALGIVPQLCDALEYAHGRGVVHRDVKPENILIDTGGRVKIADFGLSVMLGIGSTRLTRTDAVMGTPQYMAPEQVESPRTVDHRADIYSMGVVFYEMLTGELPLGHFSMPSRKAKVSRRLDEIVLRALAKEPAERYQQAGELKRDVAAAPRGVSGVARGFEWKSRATLFGWPLVHICNGVDAQGRPVKAKGIIAIGNVAIGVFAFGGLAVGGVAIGGGAVGLVALGGGAFGLLLALGGGAVGGVALGGGAVGYYALGGGAWGQHSLSADHRDHEAERFFSRWISLPPPMPERVEVAARGAGQDAGRGRSRGDSKVAPYSGVRWRDLTPEVEVEKVWYELLSIDGMPAARIVKHCDKSFGGRWRKRFEEDIVEVLGGMGSAPGAEVELRLKTLDTGETKILPRVPMTKENRKAIWQAAVDREEPGATEGLLALLGRKEASRLLTRKGAEEDLAELRVAIETRYAYASRGGVDFRGALEKVKGRLGESVTGDDLALEITKVLGPFGDGHTRVQDDPLPAGYAPFLVGDSSDGLVAFQADRRDFFEPGFPFLESIDGVPVDQWLKAASSLVPAGSPALVRSRSIRLLQNVQGLRRELGLKQGAAMAVGLRAADGARKTRQVDISEHKPVFGTWPGGAAPHRVLDGNVGYLRLARMADDPFWLKSLGETLEGFRATRGLIIDVRGNGGGGREALTKLFPYFMREEDGLRVVNVAAARIAPGEDPARKEGFLQDRNLHPLASPAWSAADREPLTKFSAAFKPEWTLPAEGFSAWHYFVVRPVRGLKPYEKPVIVLLDGDCFSATDIFLSAFKGWRNVTLLGTSSSGGSGRPRSILLGHSGISVHLSSMASYRPDGTLYDRQGTLPDIEVLPKPSDFGGGTDTLLQAALSRLR